MHDLFAYGTLMCEDIMQEVSGFRLPHERGILRSYFRRSVAGEHYPGIFPGPGGIVEGIVYLGVPEGAWARLDRFEGEMYERRIVSIELPGGGKREAATYVVRPEFKERLSDSEWDFDAFLRDHKACFRNGYTGFTALEVNG